MSEFAKFDLDEKIVKVLSDIKYETPTAIQEQAIPKILSGSDLIASAQTGTGKTGAFMLPILHLLEMNPVEKHIKPRALILVPTRELALQVADETKKYSKYLPHIRTVCIYGGVPYPIQKRALSCQYDVLIATPGRLIDHLDQQRIDLSNVQVLVLDEADRMLDMGFIDDVEQITAYTPKKRQTLLFSATIDNKILPISRKLQNNPFEIRVKQDLTLRDNIDASLYYVDDINHKMRLLDHFLENIDMTQMIIFTSTIVQTKALARYLQEKDFLAGALHGDMDQKQRTKTINRLRKGNIQILVATDVAARGIDIASLSHVINFDLPFQPEDFVHRIGRTGRAGAKGAAITFATYKESIMMSRIEKSIGKTLTVHTVEGMEPQPKTRENSQPIQRGRRSRGGRDSSRRDSRPSYRRTEDQDRKPSFRRSEESSDRQDRRPSFRRSDEQSDRQDRRPSFRRSDDQPSGQDRRPSFRRSNDQPSDRQDRRPSFRRSNDQPSDRQDRRPSFRRSDESSDRSERRPPFRRSEEQSSEPQERRPFFKRSDDKPAFKQSFQEKRPFKREEKSHSDERKFFDKGKPFVKKDSAGKPFQKANGKKFTSGTARPPRREGSFKKTHQS